MPANKMYVFDVSMQLPKFKFTIMKAIGALCANYNLALRINWLKKKNPDIN